MTKAQNRNAFTTLAPEVFFLRSSDTEKRKTSGEKRREIDFQTPYGGLTAVKHFARIIAAPFPKGIKFSQLQNGLGIIFIQPIRVTINILLVKSYFSGALHQRLSF